jgi:hypothetical protein
MTPSCKMPVPPVRVRAGGAFHVVLPAHEVTVYDPLKIYADQIGERRVVYLDNNAWIDLRDGKTPDARACRDLCRQGVEGDRAIFPASYAAVSELLEIADQASRVAQAELMESLCLGVTFRSMEIILNLEGEDVYRHLVGGTESPGRRPQVFTNLPDYFDDITLSFPEGWYPDEVDAYVALHRSTAGSLRWMVDHHQTPEQAALSHARANDYPALIDDRRAAYREHLGVKVVDRDVVAHEERVFMVNSYVLPAVKRVGLPDGDKIQIAKSFQAKMQGPGNRKAFSRSFRAAGPALESLAQIFARQSRDYRRKTTKQDFWDVEHAVVSAYADAFVSGDSYLTDVLRLGDRRPPAARSDILPSISDLVAWLKRL